MNTNRLGIFNARGEPILWCSSMEVALFAIARWHIGTRPMKVDYTKFSQEKIRTGVYSIQKAYLNTTYIEPEDHIFLSEN